MNDDAANVAGSDADDGAEQQLKRDGGSASADVAPGAVELAVQRASDVALRQLQDDGFTATLLQQRIPRQERRRAWWRRLVLGSAAGSGVAASVLTLAFEWPRLGDAMTQAAAVKVTPELAALDPAVHTVSPQSLLHWAAQQPAADMAALAVGVALLLVALGWMTRAFEP